MIKIATLMDNLPSENKALKAEHGLSFYIDVNGIPVIFDFGAGKSTLENAEKMNVPLNGIQYAICSHNHYDHAAGYLNLIEQKKVTCPFITSDYFWEEKYAYDGKKYTYLGCGYGKDLLEKNEVEHIVCKDILEFIPGAYIVTSFKRVCTLEQIPERFVKLVDGKMVLDTFEDEICLVLDTKEGLVVIVGCSHPGILNMLKTIRMYLKKPFRAVIGGTHLVEANEYRINYTIKEMKMAGIKMLGFNHCSGDNVQSRIQADPDIIGFHLRVGDCLYF